LLAGLICFGAFRLSLHGDVSPVVLTGELAPGAADSRFATVSRTSVNSRGDIVFHADLESGGRRQGSGIFEVSGGVLSPIVFQGEILEDSPGQVLGRFLEDVHINNSGDIVFAADIQQDSVTLQALFLYSGGKLRKLLDTATTAAQGQTFASFHNV